MATFTSDMVAGNQSFKPFPSGAVGVRYAKINITAAVNAGDIYKMVDIFAGETLHDVKIKSSDLDTGSGLVWGVGVAVILISTLQLLTLDKLVAWIMQMLT